MEIRNSIFSTGAAIEPPLRSYMETQFGADLSTVRIHTSRPAAHLCDLFRARAFTQGPDIFFGSGQYQPDTREGRLLLAHELVHVLQQRAAGIRDFPGALIIGSPRDPLEDEADLLAAEVLNGGLRSAITPDATGAIRRAVFVLDGTAGMTASYDGAKPGIDYVRRGNTYFATLHLTRNKGPILKGTRPSPTEAAAIRLTGTVQVIAGPRENIRDAFEFHIIQLFYLISFKASYAGQNRSDGSMVLDLAGPVSYRGDGKYVLDADPNNPASLPHADIYTGLRQVNPVTWLAIVINDDHPYADVPLLLPNPATGNVTNYLYRVTRQFQVITTLVVIDRGTGDIRPLAWIEWGGYCAARFRWRVDGAGTPLVDAPNIESSYFKAWEPKQGMPPHKGVADLIKHPPSEPEDTNNQMTADAYADVIPATGHKVNNLEIEVSGPADPFSVPPDHFRAPAAAATAP